MRHKGICVKCGKETMVQDHHYKGYGTDETAPYCQSCDRKAHNKARREGRCKLKSDESTKLSRYSYNRRSIYTKHLSSKTRLPNIQLSELVRINLNTNSLTFASGFRGQRGYQIKTIDKLNYIIR